MHRVRRRHAGIALTQTADHSASGNNRIHHVPERLRLFAALLIRKRFFAACQQHVTDRQRTVQAKTHGQRQTLRLRASTAASYHFASVSPMPASRYSAGALRMICGSTSTRKLASSKISNCSA